MGSSKFAIALLAATAAARPQTAGKTDYPYVKGDTTKGDSRSPCPALNVLANHGYLPRNGKQISAAQFSTAIQVVYNVEPSFATLLSNGALSLVSNSTGLLSTIGNTWLGTINLDNLMMHNAIEHDASLTRADYIPHGDNWSLQPHMLDTLLSDSETDYITPKSLAKSRARREWDSRLKESRIPLSYTAQTLAYGEAALILAALGRVTNGSTELWATKRDIKTWFGEERLPDGWTKPPTQITTTQITNISSTINKLSGSFRDVQMGSVGFTPGLPAKGTKI